MLQKIKIRDEIKQGRSPKLTFSKLKLLQTLEVNLGVSEERAGGLAKLFFKEHV